MSTPKLTPQQKQYVAQAKEYGKKAFSKGYTAPVLDKDFMKFLNTVTSGWALSNVRIAMYKAWHTGKVEAMLES